MPAVPQQRCTRAIRGLSSRASCCFLPQKVECDAGWHLPSQAGGASGSLAEVAEISFASLSSIGLPLSGKSLLSNTFQSFNIQSFGEKTVEDFCELSLAWSTDPRPSVHDV